MKILFVSRTRSTEKSSYNHRLLMLRQGLRRLGLKADFLYMGDWIRRAPCVLDPLQVSGLLPRLKGYDVIHAGGIQAAFPFCLFRSHFQASLIYDKHGLAIEWLLRLKLEKHKLKNTVYLLQALLLEEVVIHHSDYHLVVSRPLLSRLMAHHIPERRTLLLRNGVDVQMFKPNGSCSTDIFTVCYAGDFQVWQGVDMLIEAARMLADLDISWKFVGFRRTPDHKKWKEKIGNALGSRAELVDRVPQEELIGLLQSADLLVLPRPYHLATAVAMPTKFAEYIALGKPVLVTDVDETARFVRQYDCGLVSDPTPSGLAEAISRARSLGRPRLQAMGEQGRCLAESTFAWEVICQKYYDFLNRIQESMIR